MLISYIEKYNLQAFDTPSQPNLPIFAPVSSPTNTPNSPVQTEVFLQPNQYMVQKGDTLYNLSKRFALSVDDLIALNNLPDNAIKLGQILIVKE